MFLFKACKEFQLLWELAEGALIYMQHVFLYLGQERMAGLTWRETKQRLRQNDSVSDQSGMGLGKGGDRRIESMSHRSRPYVKFLFTSQGICCVPMEHKPPSGLLHYSIP